MVRDLIDTDNICWREELIRDLFLPCDAKITMSIPLCGSWPPDKLIWHYNANGSFSVKSAYNFIMDSNLSYTSSSSVSSHLFLQKVWALDVPPPPPNQVIYLAHVSGDFTLLRQPGKTCPYGEHALPNMRPPRGIRNTCSTGMPFAENI